MRRALNAIAALLTGGRQNALTVAWQNLRYQHTQAIRAKLAEASAPATANKALAALRGDLQECWRLALMTAEEYRRTANFKAERS
jgi:hypothetical protein